MASQRPRTNRSSSGARPRPGSDRSRNEKPLAAQKALPTLDPDNGFLALGVPDTLCGALALEGITDPFPIQVSTLPDSLKGRDVLGRGRTGSGKTLAFGLAVLTRLSMLQLDRQPFRPRALILAPTRELALQIDATISPLARRLGLRTTTIFGGVGQNPQVDALRKGVDVVVACPGRLEDLISQNFCKLDRVEVCVLDEADHMADLGFLPGVKRLLDRTPDDAQHLLFSATLDKGVDVIVKRYMSDPVTHSVDSEQSPVNTMTHHVLHVTNDDRLPVIIDLAAAPGRTIIFTRTKHRAKQLTRQLNAHGVVSVEMHGNLSQNVRTRNLAAFSDGTAAAMVATDIAARGIHVDDISLVIHADPPMEHKAYLHRSGRTARAGNEGVVVTLATESQRKDTDQLMRKAGIKPTVTKVRPDSPLLQEIAPGQRLKKSASEVKALLDVPEPANKPGGRPNSRNPRSATPSASGRPKRGGPSSGRRGSGSGASSGSSARSGSGSSSRSGSGGGSRSGAGSSSSSRSGSGSGGGGRSSGGGGSSAGSRQGSSRSAGRQGGRAR